MGVVKFAAYIFRSRRKFYQPMQLCHGYLGAARSEAEK